MRLYLCSMSVLTLSLAVLPWYWYYISLVPGLRKGQTGLRVTLVLHVTNTRVWGWVLTCCAHGLPTSIRRIQRPLYLPFSLSYQRTRKPAAGGSVGLSQTHTQTHANNAPRPEAFIIRTASKDGRRCESKTNVALFTGRCVKLFGACSSGGGLP